MSRTWLVVLSLACACTSERQVGATGVADDAGIDPRASLQLEIQGSWCGTASAEPLEQDIQLEIGPDTYTVWCDCQAPFPGETAADGSSGRYAITDYTLNGEGWGRAEQEQPSGRYARVRLEHIDVTRTTLRFERIPDYGGGRVLVDVWRCGSRDH